MGSTFKKIIKRLAPNPKKLTPQFVKKSETLTKLQNLNIVNRSVSQNYSIAHAPKWSDTKAMRANLREQHELGTTPFSKTSDMIRARDKMPAGIDRDQMTAAINAKTLRRGTIGIAIGGAAVGASAVGGAVAGAAGRTGADDLPMEPYEYSRITDPAELYSGDMGSQVAGAKPAPASGSNAGLWLMGGLLLLKVLL